MSLEQLIADINDTYGAAGLHMKEIDLGNEVQVQLYVPPGILSRSRGYTLVAREPVPSDMVGALEEMTEVGRGKIRRKLKKAIKKIAKNKVFRALGKAALAVTPGGRAVRAAFKATKAAAHIAKHAKHHGKTKHHDAAAAAQSAELRAHKDALTASDASSVDTSNSDASADDMPGSDAVMDPQSADDAHNNDDSSFSEPDTSALEAADMPDAQEPGEDISYSSEQGDASDEDAESEDDS